MHASVIKAEIEVWKFSDKTTGLQFDWLNRNLAFLAALNISLALPGPRAINRGCFQVETFSSKLDNGSGQAWQLNKDLFIPNGWSVLVYSNQNSPSFQDQVS